MRKILVLLCATCVVGLGGPAAVAGAGGTTPMAAREGDNTIYFTWNARKGRVTKATSSRRLVAGQEVELLTALVDRDGRVGMRASLKNISESTRYSVDGRIVHRVLRDGEVVKEFRSDLLDTVLEPGEKVRALFRYRLRTGQYSARSDFVAE